MSEKFEISSAGFLGGSKNEKISQDVIKQLEDKLRDLFKFADNPVGVLMQELAEDELKVLVPSEILEQVKNDLSAMIFEDEGDFISKATAALIPILIIVKNAKGEERIDNCEMFTQLDVQKIVELINTRGAKKIFVVGNVGSGKTTFSRELAGLVGYKNIDIDQWFAIFRQEQNRDANDAGELLNYIMKKEIPPFIINHADLLKQDLNSMADIVVFLNPNIKEQYKARQYRMDIGAEGEWRLVDADDYEKIIRENEENFGKLNGEVEYSNIISGTFVKVIA